MEIKIGCTYGGEIIDPETTAAWEEWTRINGALKDETPYRLLKRLRSQDLWLTLAKVTCPPDRTPEEWDIELAEFMRI